MSAVPISQLPEISITDPNAYLVIVTSGTTYKITFSALTEQFLSNTVGSGYVPLSTGGTQYTPSSIFQAESGTVVFNDTSYDTDAPEILRLSAQTDSYNIMTAYSDVNNYSQINLQNINSGSGATSDFVATADNGTETTMYVDLGINNSNYVNNGNSVGGANDAYLYSTAENFLIGNAIPGKKLVFFNGGLNAEAYSILFVHPDGSITINTPNVDDANPSALRIVNANTNSTSMIHCDSDIDDFAEINITNVLGGEFGTNASADIVATNDEGNLNAEVGYVNMGINSSSYEPTDNVGGPSDAYLYSTGRHLHIGNATSGPESNVYFFVNGKSDDAIALTIQYDKSIGVRTMTPEYPFDVSGDTRIKGSFVVQDGQPRFDDIIEAQDNADAILSGLTVGNIYRTGDFLKIVH